MGKQSKAKTSQLESSSLDQTLEKTVSKERRETGDKNGKRESGIGLTVKRIVCQIEIRSEFSIQSLSVVGLRSSKPLSLERHSLETLPISSHRIVELRKHLTTWTSGGACSKAIDERAIKHVTAGVPAAPSLVLEGVALSIDLRVRRRWNSCRFDRRGDWDDPTSETSKDRERH
jgi:hypothetical protein